MNKSEDQSSDNEIVQENGNNQELKIKDNHEYLSYCLKNKKIKVMDECNPIMPHVYLKDISLHKKGPLEDKIYSKNDKYYINIRRGNTLCQIYDENREEKDLIMCRRGMKKFYDLEPEYLKINRQLTYQHKRYRNRIFETLDERIGTHKINLYSLFKENGEHCQIGYVSKLNSWLFASKNVAILIQKEEELEDHYQKERFYWAKLIAKQFFNILKKFSPEEKEQFKIDIEGKTLLGEHCGYEKHQHITKYKQIQIIFYGIVENEGFDHCLPVPQCEQFLKKYRLKMSKMKKIEGLKNKNEVYENMYKMLKEVGEGTMDEYGEGSVMYIVSESTEGQLQCIGMCKLKTCEYLIYRRMREMIKIYFAKKGSTANNYEKYKFDINQLAQTYFKPPQPLTYYETIAEEAFKEVKKHGQEFSDDEFRYRFVNFLSNIEEINQKKEKAKTINKLKKVLLLCGPLLTEEYGRIQRVCKKNKVKVLYSYQDYSKSKLCIQHLVPRNLGEYDEILIYISEEQHREKVINELSESKDISKSHLISFIKSEDKLKSILLLEDKLRNCVEICKSKEIEYKEMKEYENLIAYIETIFTEELLDQKQIKTKKLNKTVILPLLIPGSGKTMISEILSKHMKISVLSSDKIRERVMKQHNEAEKVSKQQLYTITKKQGYEEYMKELYHSLDSNDEHVYIDRVFCPTTIVENVKEIVKHRSETKIIILAQSINMTKLNDFNYPHSINYLLICLKRVLERNEHETLSDDPYTITKVILKFYRMFRGFNYNKLSKELQQINAQFDILNIQFTKESKEEHNSHLKKKVEECLKTITPGHEPLDSDHYTELVQLIYQYGSYLEKVGETEPEKEVAKIIKKIKY